MSAAPILRVEDALAPVRDTLSAMAADPDQPPLRGISPSLAPTGPGWVPATVLTTGDAVDDLIAAARDHWRAAPHAAVALAWKSYTYWVALPAVLGYAGARRVPLLRPDAVQVRWSVESPFVRVALIPHKVEVAVLAGDPVAGGVAGDPVAGDPVAGGVSGGRSDRLRVAADDGELIAMLRASLLDDHLAVLLEQLRQRVHLGRRTLWGSVASAIAHALSRGTNAVAGSTLDVARHLLGALDLEGLVDLGPAPAGLTVHRRTCCLAFTLPTPKVCGGCPITR
jgi:hypothetical protein